MQTFINAPHRGGPGAPSSSPNAALLIDFDNVTMGIRSDLTRQLKELLNSDIIRGKVAVQRAYADWRRYAQYIVPLSEASVDLIFAPAYGSSKKNATDIRLAIDALELVFTRPEIGVYILLSGDSDFSSLVLKLKEYGKYVIGVGLRESASDLLVQNCDEYYSYSSLTGLTKAGEEDTVSEVDPWDLAERAVHRMADENDVMRSDRLKQVMLELDPNFDESKIGYSKFNKFLVEASSRNKLGLRKLDNGQYEVQPFENGGTGEVKEERRRGRGRRDRQEEARPERQEAAASSRAPAREAAREPEREPQRAEPRRDRAASERPKPKPSTRERRAETLEQSYELLQRAVRELIESGGGAARDSDIKRQMLEIQPGWDESELGFTKFSRFLRQAHDAEAIDLARSAEGFYEARPPRGASAARERDRDRGGDRDRDRDRDRDADRGRRDRGREPRRDTQATEPAASTRTERDASTRTERDARPEGEPEARKPEPKPEPKPEREPRAEVKAEPKEEPAAAPKSDAAEARPSKEAPPSEGAAPAEKAATETAQSDTAAAAGGRAARSMGRGRKGRRGGPPEGPPPVLPGQVVGGKGGNGGPAAGAGAAGAAGAAEATRPEVSEPEVSEPVTSEPTPSEAPAPEATTAEAPAEAPADAPAETPTDTSRPERKRPDRRPAETQLAFDEAGSPAQAAPGAGDDFDPDAIGLPTDDGAVIRYLSNSYQGVGQKTAEALIEAFGADRVFNGLHSEPERVKAVLGTGRRTEALLTAWQRDYRRRTTGGAAGSKDAGDRAGA